MLEFNLSVSENRFNQLQSKDLKKNLNKMLQAMSGVNKNQWQYAIALHNIVSNEYYKPDFKTVPDFADAIGLDKGTVSRYVSSVKIMVNTLTPKYGISFEQMPYSKAASLATIKNLDEFIKVMGIDLLKVTSRELEQAKRDYKAMQDSAVNGEKQETETKQETEKQDEPVNGYVENESIVLTFRNKTYIIPFDELKHYKRK